MPKQIKVLFLPTANPGVVWQRMLLFFRYMSKDPELSMAMDKFYADSTGIYPWQYAQNHSTALLQQIQKIVGLADVVVIQYILTDYAIAVVKGLRQLFPDKPILTEIDDYCIEVNHYNPVVGAYRPDGETVTAIVDQLVLSDAVIASTPYLKKMYSQYNKNIYVIPNGIDFGIWDKLNDYPRKEKIRIGWAGAATHNEDLRSIEKVVEKILDKYPNVEFYFKGGVPPFKKHPRIIMDGGWANPYEYPKVLKKARFDIGLAPLLDNNFNRAKSNLRWLEYSAMKIPTVASDVEPFKKSIKDGETGFLCNEPEDWTEALEILINDAERRKEVGLNAHNDVKKNFNTEIISKEYSKVLKEIYEPRNAKKQVSAVDARSHNDSH